LLVWKASGVLFNRDKGWKSLSGLCSEAITCEETFIPKGAGKDEKKRKNEQKR